MSTTSPDLLHRILLLITFEVNFFVNIDIKVIKRFN